MQSANVGFFSENIFYQFINFFKDLEFYFDLNRSFDNYEECKCKVFSFKEKKECIGLFYFNKKGILFTV